MEDAGGGRVLEGSILEEQISLETEATARGVARYRRLASQAVDRGEGASLKPVERLLVGWFAPLVMAIEEEQRLCSSGAPGEGRAHYGPIIRCLDADRIAVVTMHEALGNLLMDPKGCKTVRVTYSIGSACIAEIHWDLLKKEEPGSIVELEGRFKRLNTHRRNWWAKKKLSDHLWNRRVCTQLGARLLKLLLAVASLDYEDEKFRPAICSQMLHRNNKTHAIIVLNDDVKRTIEEGHSSRQILRPRYLPMIVPPYPWAGDAQVPGGYVRIRTPFISKPTPEQEAALAQADLETTYEAIDYLGLTPWSINAGVLDYCKTVWDSGGREIGMPSRDTYALPPRPADIAENAEAKKKWKQQAYEIHTLNHRESSSRAEWMMTLGTAEMMAGRDRFYLPHMCDFRSRATPIPAHLNHHRADLVRGLLLFGHGRPLDDGAWRQIQIHAANMWGFDKAPFDDRVAWTEANVGLMSASGKDPLNHTWWQGAEEPSQFLAACIAMVDEDVAERLPIQVDGTCNGLQHGAGESLHPDDAAAVNLAPGPWPNDPYADVVSKAAQLIDEDDSAIADLIRPHVIRKNLKQVVMTTPYGRTAVGAREQVRTALKKAGFPNEHLLEGAKYLSKHTIAAIGEVCGGSTAIMEWLQSSARKILKRYPSEVITWTTPLGFPVVQPYRNLRTIRIQTCLHRLTVPWLDSSLPAKLRKQVAGIVPNYIHSLDATHMLCTALRCKDEDIVFAAVHDCYWTHAVNSTRLGRILREEFVELYQQSQLLNLLGQWQIQYPDVEFDPLPPRGKFDINDVLDSEYFFS